MALKWKYSKQCIGHKTATAKLGIMNLIVDEVGEEYLNYRIVIRKSKRIETIFDCEGMNILGMKFDVAKSRVERIAKCLYHGIPITCTVDEAQAKAIFKPNQFCYHFPQNAMLCGIVLNGIYKLPQYDGFFFVSQIANLDVLRDNNSREIHLPKPTVIVKEVFNDHYYAIGVDDFKSRHFEYQHPKVYI